MILHSSCWKILFPKEEQIHSLSILYAIHYQINFPEVSAPSFKTWNVSSLPMRHLFQFLSLVFKTFLSLTQIFVFFLFTTSLHSKSSITHYFWNTGCFFLLWVFDLAIPIVLDAYSVIFIHWNVNYPSTLKSNVISLRSLIIPIKKNPSIYLLNSKYNREPQTLSAVELPYVHYCTGDNRLVLKGHSESDVG